MSPPIVPLIVPPASWPADDRQRWDRAVAGKGYQRTENPAARWSPSRREIVEDAYGRFLGLLEKEKGKLAGGSAVNCVAPKNIDGYVAYLRETLAPHSVTLYFYGLQRFVAVTTPVKDIDWMGDRYRKMKARSVPTRQKTAHLRHTADLVRYGLTLMKEVKAETPSRRRLGIRAAQKYQAGLMILILAADPLRIRNFQDIEIGRSLVYEQKRYLLRFEPDETKTGARIEDPLPVEIEPFLKIFCSIHRPALLKQGGRKANTTALWIDRSGKKMGEAAVRDTIKRWTKLKFGKHVWPHLFRDAAATSIAQDDPEHVGVITSVLSHTSIGTAKKHYDQSTKLKASRESAEMIHVLRTSAEDPDGEGSAF